ncbi:hypothetical protein WH47_05973 [Habropoda laboriosa]|uniref:Synaptosomal-associated protein 29 n=1 Tax=Habropoda laboriosa TaxID=597456 RepID=A0A0L7REQ5_9HYME|nr:PREDICTED: uncharacterized protein LOC108578987 [Habropoda laboriosa]KOC69309.1 hypothetical protein WH47_05973 [Habropoda laboriosa]
MSQAYIHACERAELLGLPIPNEEEWKETQKIEEQNNAQDDEDEAVMQNLDSAHEAAQRIGGGLDELNSILISTQKKINRFKTVCGSLGTLLKVKGESKNSTPDHKLTERNHNEARDVDPETSTNEDNLTLELSNDKKQMENTEPSTTMQKKIDLNKKMGSHLDKLDSLITKAEDAQYSMQYQTKQIKRFLK